MKTFIFLLSFVSVICLISCGKTDSDSKPEPTTPTTANTPTGTTPTGTTPTANTPTGITPTGTTPTANTSGKQKYSSPSGQGRHPPIATPTTTICNINNYKDFINKPGVHNCYLQGADLRRSVVDLQGANLQGADLTEAILQGANLQGADLRGAKFDRANLKWVDMRGAKITKEQEGFLKRLGFSGMVVVE